jgi:betaine-aldehyde dehydrogenase
MVVKEPLGVVAAIVPWNYPLLLLFWKLAPALAAGNCVIVKPSELTPLSTLALAPLFSELPSGTVQILVGSGEVGAALVANQEVDGIAFTGSTATGKAIAHAAIDRMARVNLELGGKDAMLICDDLSSEQLQIAAEGTAWAAFLNTGQVCTSTERIFVPRSRADEFTAALISHTESLRVGDPTDPDTDVGPMVSGPQRAKALTQIESAISGGAIVRVGGTDGGHDKGYFMTPAVVTGLAADADLIHEETFGPVAPVVIYDDLDDAISQINASRYGLGANLYTSDLQRAIGLTRAIKAGTVWCNDPLTDNDAGPFGGFRQSGLGRELGPEGLEAFQETKHIHIDPTIARKQWWYPYGA